MLEGIRVIDFSQYLPGPFATLRLVDWGADVIKIEPPQGDPARTMAEGALFAANNRGKKSVAVDLKSDEGIQSALDLIQNADVIVESFRPGVMDRLGLGYEEASSLKPDLVYLSLTGFGQNSLYSHQGSHDLNYMAMSGMLNQLKDKEGRPVMPTQTVADLIGGMAASEAIIAALFKRERTGKGTYIDLAMTDAVFSMMTNHAMLSKIAGIDSGIPVLDGSYANYRIYETKDRRYMSMGALEYKFWKNFCQAIGRDDWLAEFPERLKQPETIQEVEKVFLTKTFDEWIQVGRQHDCCLFPILEISEVLEGEYVKERGLVHEKEGRPFVQTHDQTVSKDDHIADLNEHRNFFS
ncbi:CaiB/BaiF CoA transferase family protein [Piscibacillus halophilus]|uniref:CaiB/BaiF CoA transferase family protein n=1 Tax=Piscibacillus halophilus TaxID=571933 RepID=UPI001589CA29|nr:CoA transferase [Piscibacillus halophilus]